MSARTTTRAAALLVVLGAAVATSHGLYVAAESAGVPPGIAWLYPLITDGLALVAYAATARLSGSAARYAWSVVVLAAGLSGLAQAAHLVADVGAPPELRFGVGAWPAVAAAVVAHLLYLLATADERPAARHPAADAGPAWPKPSPAPTRSLERSDLEQHAAPELVDVEHQGDDVEPGPAGDVDPLRRTRELLAEAGDRPLGRRTVARQLGVSEWEARGLLAAAQNGEVTR